MKKDIKLKLGALLLLVSVSLSGCIEEPPEVGEPFDRVSNLSGTWSLNKVIQNDEDAIRKGFPAFVQTLNVTEILPFKDLSITLNADPNGAPTSFIVVAGNAPNIAGATEGTWTLDDPEAPSEISFQGGTTLEIENYLGLTEGILNLKLTRYQVNSKGEKSAFLSYQYEFIKQH